MSNSEKTAIPVDSSSTALTEITGEAISNTANDCDTKSDAMKIPEKEENTVGVSLQNIQKATDEGLEDPSMRFLNSSNEKTIPLSEVISIKDLDQNSIRDMLRRHTGDDLLKIVSIGPLKDMSGMNDAFNSCICSLHCIAEFNDSKKSKSAIVSDESTSNTAIKKEFNFVVKSPPTSSMMQLAHKFTKPFCNEVSWYIDLVQQLQLTQPPGAPPVLEETLPICYHAVSSYHTLEVGGNGDEGLSSCW